MAVGAATYKFILRRISPKNQKKVDIVRNAKSAYKSVINILIETKMLIVRGQTIYVVFIYENYVVD
jgi:hypothetical protein